MKIGAIVTVVRDLTCLAVGVFGVIHQELSGRVNPELLVVYTALLGLPGAISVLQLVRGTPITTATQEQSSSSPAVSQQAER